MIAKVIISGGISGMHTILNKLHHYDKQEAYSHNKIVLTYNKVLTAREDLAEAWRNIKAEEPEYCSREFRKAYITRLGNGMANGIVYDASKAVLETYGNNELI